MTKHPASDRSHYQNPAKVDPPGLLSDNSEFASPPGRSFAGMLQDYSLRLERSPLSEHTRRAYRRHVSRFLDWLEASEIACNTLWDPNSRDFGVRDYRRALKDRKLAASTVNAAGLGRPLLVRSGAHLVMVAELAGHRSLETTRRYSLPTEEDREAAVEVVAIDP